MQIKDSTFLVTGGSLGIGKATAKMLIEKGGKACNYWSKQIKT